MWWPSVSAVGWLVTTTLVIVLARTRTARWEREQEQATGTGNDAGPSEDLPER
jgi:hypothetical protein